MRWAGTGYRAHHPRWAWSPLSGEGAALKGGRFNPRGVPALYLALSVEGMFCEMGHGFAHVFEPLTVCSYTVDMEDVADLRTDAAREESGITLDDMAIGWEYELSCGRRPASWSVHDSLVGRGIAGILVPSFARGARDHMYNLVLWRWSDALPHKIEVHDPSGRLPRGGASWG